MIYYDGDLAEGHPWWLQTVFAEAAKPCTREGLTRRVEKISPIDRGIPMRQVGQDGHSVLRVTAKVLVVGLCANLAGCGNSDINAVKKQTLGQDQSYTVEQVFDNRKVCDSVKWDEITDDRGRKIVEYRCTFNGVDDYVSNALANATKKLKDQNQSAKDAYGKDAQDELSLAEKRLAATRASGLAPEPFDNIPDEELGGMVNHTEKLLRLLSDAEMERDYSKVIVTDFWGGLPQSEVSSDALHQAVVIAQDDIRNGHGDLSNPSTWPGSVYKDYTALSIAMSDETQKLESQIRIPEARLDVVNAKKKLDSLLANKDQAFASLDADLSSKLQQLNANAITSIDELFQWSMSENGDPVFVFAGSEYKFKNGKGRLVNYYDVGTQHAIQAMIRNDTTTYAQYVVETNLGG